MKKDLYKKTDRINFLESPIIKKQWIQHRKIRGFSSLSDYIRYTVNKDIQEFRRSKQPKQQKAPS